MTQSASGGLASFGPTNAIPVTGMFSPGAAYYAVPALTTAGSYSCAPADSSTAPVVVTASIRMCGRLNSRVDVRV